MKLSHTLSIGVLLLATSAPAHAQRFGQWSWRAVIATVQSRGETSTENRMSRETETETLRLRLGIDGFIIHPAIGGFRIDVASALMSIGSFDRDRLDYDGELSLIPRSAYPVRLYMSRNDYTYSLSEDDLIGSTLAGLADTVTTAGGSIRLRTGPLHGTFISTNRTAIDFVDSDQPRDRHTRDFLSWKGRSGPVKHVASLQRTESEYGKLDFSFQDIVGEWGSSATLSRGWNWRAKTNAYLREFDHGQRAPRTTEFYRLLTTLQKRLRRSDHLMVSYTGGVSSGRDVASSLSHGLEGRYLREMSPRWWLEPVVRYTSSSSDQVSLQAPEAGIRVGWQGSFLTASGQLRYGEARRDSEGRTSTSTNLGFNGNASLSFKGAGGFRTSLTAGYAANEFRSAGEPISELPDLGIGRERSGLNDRVTLRTSTYKSWDSSSVNAWADWSRSVNQATPDKEELVLDQLQFNLGIHVPRVTLTVQGGSSRIGPVDPEKSDTASIGSSIRLWRALEFEGGYQIVNRQVSVGPDADLERYTGRLGFQMGLFSFGVEYTETRDRPVGGPERRDRSFRVSLSRAFRGWLPIVSAPQRRGVIR